MNLNIFYSSQLMDNYVQFQEEFVDNSARFEALQTQEGHTLFFCLGKDGQFYLIQETNFHDTGWVKTSLTQQIKDLCFKNAQTVQVKTFDVRQNEKTGTIHLATIFTVDGRDQLVQVMGVTNQDAIWKKPLAWKVIDFDDRTYPNRVVMADVFVSYAADSTWSVVDILRNPNDSIPLVKRYYIENTDVTKWHLHEVSIDIEAGKCTNKIGRIKDEEGDGIYTLGHLQGTQQLIYHPLYNYDFPDISPNPTRLNLAGNVNIDAIALTSLRQDAHTDVFAIGGNALYYFSADNQSDSSVGKKLIEADIFTATKSMYAQSDGKQVIIWGLTASEEIYYTACQINRIEAADAWSHPLPLVSGAKQIAPYLNTTNSGNTFFAHTGINTLVKLEQSPSTSLWTEDPIMLATLNETKATKIKSFTTEIRVTNEQNEPLIEEGVWLSAASRSSFLINGKYVVLDEKKQQVLTNQTGNISIIEMVEDIKGETIYVHGGSKKVEIDPTQTAINKLTSLDSLDKLKGAKVDDGKGNLSALVDANVSSADLSNTVRVLQELGTIGKSQPRSLKSVQAPAAVESLIPIASFTYSNPNMESRGLLTSERALGGIVKKIWTSAGNALRVIGNAVKKAAQFTVQISKDAATGIYNLACKIGETVINFVVETAKAVAKVCVKIFELIKTAAQKVWNFLKFLFNWEDIKRTKEVFYKAIEIGMDQMIEGIKTTKNNVHEMIQGLRDNVVALAQTMAKESGQGTTVATNSQKEDPLAATANSSEGSFFKNHFMNNIKKSNDTDAPIGDPIVLPEEKKDIVTRLLAVLEEVRSQIQSGSFDTKKLLSKLLYVLDSVIGLLQDGVDFVFDLVITGIEGIYALLIEPIRIPVLSDILEEHFGLPKFSLLDIICYIGALPTTIIYKVFKGKAPFEANEPGVQKILSYQRPKNRGLQVTDAVPNATYNNPATIALTGSPSLYASDSEKVGYKESDYLSFLNELSFEFKKKLFFVFKLGKIILQGVSDWIQDINLAAVGAQAKAGTGGQYLQLMKKPIIVQAGPLLLGIAESMLFSVDYHYKGWYKKTSDYLKYTGWAIATLDMIIAFKGIGPNRVTAFKLSYCLKAGAGLFNSLIFPIVNLANVAAKPAMSGRSTTTIVLNNTNRILAFSKVGIGLGILYSPENMDKLLVATRIVSIVKFVTSVGELVAFGSLEEKDFMLLST